MIAPRRPGAPAPRARSVAGGLQVPLFDGAAIMVGALAVTEALRGFAAGNSFLPGQIVDRSA